MSFGSAALTTMSDAQGEFTFASIPVGPYQLELFHQDYYTSVFDFQVLRPGEFVVSMEPRDVGPTGLVTGVIGEVVDGISDSRVPNVLVRPNAPGIQTQTDSRGRFSLTALPPGEYAIDFTRLGYVSQHHRVQVEPGRVTRLRVSLAADPIEVHPIEVSVERREVVLQATGFYERADDGFGEFIDRAEIESRAPAEMTDIFRVIPGAMILADSGNPLERYVILRSGRSESCFPQVILDGVVVHRGGDEPAQIDHFVSPAAVAGVEVYKSSAGLPVQYTGTDTSCGVILIWTNR